MDLSDSDLLLANRFAPITSCVGLLEAPLDAVLDTYIPWQEGIYKPDGKSIVKRSCGRSLELALKALLPLTSTVSCRRVFIPTSSQWTAFFDNGARGTNASSVAGHMALLMRCRGLRVTAVPHTIHTKSGAENGRHGALILELFGPEKRSFLNTVRTLSVAHDSDRWVFQTAGEHLAGEDPAEYSRRLVRNRFTFASMKRILNGLGVAPFAEEFYCPAQSGDCVLVEVDGPLPEGCRSLSLEEVRATF
jgi:hypothetical protein